MIQDMLAAMQKAIAQMKAWPAKSIQVFHHNDADGLSSGAILTRALEREGYGVKRFCLEKPYPQVLERVFQQEGGILIFADFAGRIVPLLSKLNQGRNLTLILDHHPALPSTGPRVLNLDPELFGLKGDRDIAAATTCYLFAATLNPDNRDLAWIGAVGAVGDKFFVDGKLVSQNREVALEAARQGLLEVRSHPAGEHYVLRMLGADVRCDELGVCLDMLGGGGYYQGGPDMGVRVLLQGPSRESDQMVEKFKAVKEKAFSQEAERLRSEGLRHAAHIQWFSVGERFTPMGVKMIGLFCEAIREMEFIDPRKYIAGFQVVPNEIPGFGPIDFNQVKISMRVPPFMEGEIREARAMGLNTFLPEATARLGGFSDACHSLTAATTVALGKEEALINEMENILQ